MVSAVSISRYPGPLGFDSNRAGSVICVLISRTLDVKTFEKRTVEPWHLACISGQWYLLGYDRNREARRIFVLARMQKVS